MFIDLIETLRCPAPHEDSWLVGAFDEIVDRDVRAGRLGCPVCRAEYPIVGGVVHFEGAGSSTSTEAGHAGATIGADAALRLAAMLDLASPGGLVVLEGAWARAGNMLAGFVDTRLLLLNPPHGLAERERLSAVMRRDTVPVAAGSCRGIALHEAAAAERLAASLASALRPRGRLVIPASAPVPDGFELLARDAAWLVAERSASPSALVALQTKRGG